ncbi:MAG: sigma-70 family RNA polymerase sigma factor [Saprospiraceae bacterium]|nr:sigma-70 family RNA polymerase sigma factor [Saprospiraceae bacterium]
MTFYSENEFKKFYLDSFKGVRTFIFAKCNDLSLAEDIAQEAFVRLWDNLKKVEREKARSFVFTVSNNLFLDHVRHEKVKYTYNSGLISQQEIKDPQYLIEMDEFRKKLDATIQSMPEISREVFLLNRIEKMTYNQIAESLGLSVKAIEKRMQKALEIMAKLKLKT